jgi:adenosylmethionine-8-amino-7-oxononanoate aminotransferase
MVHTGRNAFLSLEGSYHGNSIGGLSIGASENRETFANLLPHCDKVEPPLDGKALGKVERRLKRRDVAAFIMEPIGINLGVLIPDAACMTELQRLCRRYGTLLIMDEVATGFGRTGAVFATEHFDLEPDLMCVGKAITGGVSGMAATIATAAVAKSMEDEGTFYSTYGWHPRSVEAAIATIRGIVRHRKPLLDHVVEMSGYFSDRLACMRFTRVKHVAAIRVKGLAIGIDLKTEDEADRLQAKCRRHRLLTSTEGSTLLLLPALNISRRVAKDGLDILEKCVG